MDKAVSQFIELLQYVLIDIKLGNSICFQKFLADLARCMFLKDDCIRVMPVI